MVRSRLTALPIRHELSRFRLSSQTCQLPTICVCASKSTTYQASNPSPATRDYWDITPTLLSSVAVYTSANDRARSLWHARLELQLDSHTVYTDPTHTYPTPSSGMAVHHSLSVVANSQVTKNGHVLRLVGAMLVLQAVATDSVTAWVITPSRAGGWPAGSGCHLVAGWQ